ncbi:hypothetical protein GCM10025880_15020 [Methylorubrum aminovorans]|nr:hypothetical protein GCM10025880_15020 [Methylorubrum aminovorans]
MPLYEHVFLARQDVTAQQVETMVETYKGVIEAGGGTVEKIESWGVKSLAYRIKKNRKAHFTLLNISAPRPPWPRWSARCRSPRTCCAS